MTEPERPIVGWTVPEEPSRGGRRPIGELVGDVFGTYHRRARPILWLSLVIEGIATIVTLPYLVVATAQTFGFVAEVWQSVLSRQPFFVSELPDVMTNPLYAAIGGVVSVVPFASALVLSGAAAALIMAPADRPLAPSDALRAVLRRWAPILLPVVVLAGGYALVAALAAGYSASIIELGRSGSRLPDPQLIAASLLIAVGSWVILAVAVYLAVRWAVAVPAFVIEGLGLRAGLARSTAMTRGRMIHVFLALLVIVILYGIAGWLLAVVPLALTIALALVGGGPLLAVPVGLYVAGRVLIAPLPAILIALLYRDFRAAEANGPP